MSHSLTIAGLRFRDGVDRRWIFCIDKTVGEKTDHDES